MSFESRGAQQSRGGGYGGRNKRRDPREPREPRDPNIPRPKPPPHLRGKQIGLFYRDINKHRQREPDRLNLPDELKRKIQSVLDSIPEDRPGAGGSAFFRKEYNDIVSVPFTKKLDDALVFVTKYRRSSSCAQDEELYNEHVRMLSEKRYCEMLEFRKKLPAYQKRYDILKCVRENQVCVISGETGCGKTTQVGQLILEEACAERRGSSTNILIMQPRRIAASSVAERIAAERGEALGNSVGYTIRLESKPPRNCGSIELITNGILLQRLQSDPGLLKISHLILDEVHERDSICDISMGVIKKIIAKRNDLKLILMSATMDSVRFCQYFGQCPQLHIPGLMFPVREFYLEDVLQLTGFTEFEFPNPQLGNWRPRRNEVRRFEEERRHSDFTRMMRPYAESLRGTYSNQVIDLIMTPESENLTYNLVVSLVRALCYRPKGAILVFLPGYADISKVCQRLMESNLPPCLILPLHSRMNSSDQNAIFRTPPMGFRKIIVATNIAETSITIDDVVYVVDSGKMKVTDYISDRNTNTLKAAWISEANAIQRRGRAGRCQPGECWKLYTKMRALQFSERLAPELLREPLHEPILSVLLLRLGPANTFLRSLLDPPELDAITNSMLLLRRMGILNEENNLTPLGVHVARLPVLPGAARMLLLSALLSVTGPATAIAAYIAFKEPFTCPLGKEAEVEKCKKRLAKGMGSDQIAVAEAQLTWENMSGREARDFCYENFLSSRILEMLREMRHQFGSLLRSAKFLNSSNPDSREANLNANNYSLIKALVVSGLYPNIATYKSSRKLTTETDKHVEVFPGSVNFESRSPPAARLAYLFKQESSKVFIHGTSPANALALLFFGDKYTVKENPNDMTTVFVEMGEAKWVTSHSTADLLGKLRLELDKLLQKKLENPGPTDWNSSEGHILRAIIDLVTAEDDPVYLQDNDLN